MTYSRCSKCWNTLYMYKEDLLWVWREWGAAIIRNNRDPPPTPRRYTLRSQRTNIRVWRHPYDLWPIAAVANVELHYTFIKKTCYEYEGNGGPQSSELTETHLLHQGDPLSGSGFTETESKYQGVAALIWPVAAVTVTGAELHYTCMNQTCYEYEVGGVPQSYPNTHCKWQTKRIS
jgi:hypothetical protein